MSRTQGASRTNVFIGIYGIVASLDLTTDSFAVSRDIRVSLLRQVNGRYELSSPVLAPTISAGDSTREL